MDDMKALVDEIGSGLKKFSDKTPEQMSAFRKLMGQVLKEGMLDVKTKELIAVALSVASQCGWCISLHVKKALEIGATPEEIREACWVAVLMGGGPSLMYFQMAEKAIEDFEK